MTPLIPEYLVSKAGESPSQWAGRLTAEAFKLHLEVQRLRKAIAEHREARSTLVTENNYYSDNVHDERLWRILEDG
jgi:hypothetical protein